MPLLTDASGFHAHMSSSNKHSNSFWLKVFFECVCDLDREALLNLEASRESVGKAGQL
jgi:hypothetical protein